MKKTLLASAVSMICAGHSGAYAAAIDDGKYKIGIVPSVELYPGTGILDIGCPTGDVNNCSVTNYQNSSFTFGDKPNTGSQFLMDSNLPLLTVQVVGGPPPQLMLGADGKSFSSSLGGDGFGGSIDIEVSGETFTVTNMQVDLIQGTAGGDFAQNFVNGTSLVVDTSQMSGSIDQTTGAMTLIPTGRLGGINSGTNPGSNPAQWLVNKDWNVDDSSMPGNTAWDPLTTGPAQNNSADVTGTPASNVGDLNGDTLDDYHAVLVHASQVGQEWGTFAGASVIEVWSIDILSVSPRPVDDNDTLSLISGNSKSIPVLANDGGKPALTVTAKTDGALGAVAIDAGGTSVTYTSSGTTGSDSFTYTVTDGDSNSDTATVNMTIVGTQAVANNDGAASAQEQTVNIDLAANDTTAAAGETINVASINASTPANGNVTVIGDGTVDYVSAAGFVGTDTFTYTIQDTAANVSNPATVTVTVSAAPVVSGGGIFSPGPDANANGVIDAADLPEDTDATDYCVGGCYDFVINSATNPTTLVLTQLSQPVPEDAVYRKLINGVWQDFDTLTTGDTVASAPLASGGGCPGINDLSWSLWNGAAAGASHVGHECIRLAIADNVAGSGGPNDSDQAATVIADPGGIGIFPADNNSAAQSLNDLENDSGCTLADAKRKPAQAGDWLLLAGFIGLLGWLRRSSRRA